MMHLNELTKEHVKLTILIDDLEQLFVLMDSIIFADPDKFYYQFHGNDEDGITMYVMEMTICWEVMRIFQTALEDRGYIIDSVSDISTFNKLTRIKQATL